MAVPSLQKIADDIKTLDDAGLLDLATLNRHLWPVAVIRLIDTSSGLLCTERERQSSGAENAISSPRANPTQSTIVGPLNKSASDVAEDIGVRVTESAWGLESASTQGRPPHHRTSESTYEGIRHNGTSTALEKNQKDTECATSDSIASEERRSARLASRGNMMYEGRHPAVDPVRRRRKGVRRVEQGIDNTSDKDAMEQGSRNGCVLFAKGKVSKDQTLSGDILSDAERANERFSPPTAYPKSLMVQPPTWTYGKGERGTKRSTSDDGLQPVPAKRYQTLSIGKTPCPSHTSISPQSRNDLLSEVQQRDEYVSVLRSQFRSRWAEKLPTFDAWHSLDRFARIGTRPDQEAYEELETIMQRVLSIGTLKVQANFAQSVTAWMASPHITDCTSEPPAHLETIPGFEAGPFQRFWKAMEISRCAKGVEDMAILLRRKSLVDLMAAYNEVTKHVRHCAAGGKLKLRSGETAGAKAREIVYSILYPEAETRTKMRNCFNYDQQCANSYVKLEKHFGNPGILAMIPTKLNEMDFRSTDARFAAFLQVLDIIRPELRGPRVGFYAKIVKTIAGGGLPDASTLQELAVWTSTKSPLHSTHSTEEALSATIHAMAESIFPFEGLYRSVDDRSQLALLPELQREQILNSRSELVHREAQDRLISEGLCTEVAQKAR